ncbi:MAG TPA: SGNH/GDSL hydrolase family protein [Pseudonocardiaceae bacterium]
MSRRFRTALFALPAITALTALLSGVVAAPTATAQTAPPNSMASLGDSITRAFNACGWYSDCIERSWSTGTDTTVNSHARRIRAVNPSFTTAHNDASTGARANAMAGQAATAVSQGVQYVTMEIGANDACTSSESTMTAVSTFRSQIDAALGTLRSGLPNARVFIASIPDIKRLWFVGKDNGSARFFWSAGSICQSMLANPTSTSATDTARRDRVRQRVIDFNTQLAQACAAYGPNCKFDNNAVFNYQFVASQVSGWDYFHPNAEGQRVLAEVSYRAGFNW